MININNTQNGAPNSGVPLFYILASTKAMMPSAPKALHPIFFKLIQAVIVLVTSYRHYWLNAYLVLLLLKLATSVFCELAGFASLLTYSFADYVLNDLCIFISVSYNLNTVCIFRIGTIESYLNIA